MRNSKCSGRLKGGDDNDFVRVVDNLIRPFILYAIFTFSSSQKSADSSYNRLYMTSAPYISKIETRTTHLRNRFPKVRTIQLIFVKV